MDKATVNRLLRRDFWPLLKAEGFVRRGEIARWSDDPVVHVVEVVHTPRRHAFRVDMGAHLLPLGDVSGHAVDPATLREPGCAWRDSVVPGFLDDVSPDFAYGRTEEEASEMVAFLVSEWPRQSEAFFGRLRTWPTQFHERAHAAADSDLHPAHLLTWARVAALVGDFPLARRITEVALPRVPERATGLLADLTAIRDDPHAGVPQLH